jgi:hypothetical protein
MAKKTVKPEVPAKAKKPAAVKAAPVKKAVSKKDVDQEAIRLKAEEIYHARIARGEHGTAEDDWHNAEKLLKAGGKAPARKVAAKKPAAKKK